MADNDVVKRRFVEVPEIHSFLGIKSDPESCRAGSSSATAPGQLHGSLSRFDVHLTGGLCIERPSDCMNDETTRGVAATELTPA